MLRNVIKGNSTKNTIRHVKDKGYESYDNIIEYIDNYGAEGGSVTAECYLINTLKVGKLYVGV